MDEIEMLWRKYNEYKKTAEQYMFPTLLFFDKNLIPCYEDLKKKYTDEHAKTFKRMLILCMEKLGIYEEG